MALGKGLGSWSRVMVLGYGLGPCNGAAALGHRLDPGPWPVAPGNAFGWPWAKDLGPWPGAVPLGQGLCHGLLAMAQGHDLGGFGPRCWAMALGKGLGP